MVRHFLLGKQKSQGVPGKLGRHLGGLGICEASGRHLGSTWEAPGRHLGSLWRRLGSIWEAVGAQGHLGAKSVQKYCLYCVRGRDRPFRARVAHLGVTKYRILHGSSASAQRPKPGAPIARP